MTWADSGDVAIWMSTTGSRKATTGHERSDSATAMQMRMRPSTCGLVAAWRREGTSFSRSRPIAAVRHSPAPTRMSTSATTSIQPSAG